MAKHTPEYCNVRDCKEEAEKWIGIDIKTFYLCAGHCEVLQDEAGDFIQILNPISGRITEHEIAEYSCNEECEECNY